MKKPIDLYEYAGPILRAVKKGVLLTTKAGEKVNAMTIGWGSIGIEWGKPIFTAYVRESRFTWEMLEQNGEFTVNIPLGEADRQALRLCGSKSGRDMDKIAAAGLTLVEGEKISVPGIREFPLTLECKVLYRQLQDADRFPRDIQEVYFPLEETGRDKHVAYYAEIVGAYVIED